MDARTTAWEPESAVETTTDRARANVLIPLAVMAEMADRVHEDRWDADLDQVLVDYIHSKQEVEP